MNPCDPHCGYSCSLQRHNIYPPSPGKEIVPGKEDEGKLEAWVSVSVAVYITPSAPWAESLESTPAAGFQHHLKSEIPPQSRPITIQKAEFPAISGICTRQCSTWGVSGL